MKMFYNELLYYNTFLTISYSDAVQSELADILFEVKKLICSLISTDV